MKPSAHQFEKQMREKGWVVYPDGVPQDFASLMAADLEKEYEKRRAIQLKNGIDVNTDGTAHHLLERDNSFLTLMDKLPFTDFMQTYFGGNFILNSFGGVINMKSKASYVCNVHRDVRSFTSDIKLMINMLVMLDDFTLENGATYVLSGSHLKDERPSDETFFKNADRVTGKKGSVLLFDSNLWHAAGENKTDTVRRAITLTFTKPFMKPQLDYPRYLGYEFGESLSENCRQLIGYNARIPANLDEWYQPPHKRMYRPGQG